MNVDSVQNGISHLVLAVTATVVGTFHSPIPLDSPILQKPIVVENKIYHNSQEVLTTDNVATNNVLGIGIITESTISAEPISSIPSVPKLTPTPLVVSTRVLSTTVATSKITPTITPTSTPKPNPTEVKTTPTETNQEITLNVPSYEPITTGGLNSDTLLQLINQHREGLGLPALIKDEQLCKVADYRKPQLYDEIFTSGNIHKGFYDLNLPYYITENMAHYGSEQAILNWWLGSPIHSAAIEGNSKYSCGACSGNSCAQLFTNYTPKS